MAVAVCRGGREAVEEHRGAQDTCVRLAWDVSFSPLIRIEGVVERDVCDPINPRREGVHQHVVSGQDLGEGFVVAHDVVDELERLARDRVVRVLAGCFDLCFALAAQLVLVIPTRLREDVPVEEADRVRAAEVTIGQEHVVEHLAEAIVKDLLLGEVVDDLVQSVDAFFVDERDLLVGREPAAEVECCLTQRLLFIEHRRVGEVGVDRERVFTLDRVVEADEHLLDRLELFRVCGQQRAALVLELAEWLLEQHGLPVRFVARGALK